MSVLDILFVHPPQYSRSASRVKDTESQLAVDISGAKLRAQRQEEVVALQQEWSNKIHNWVIKEVEHSLAHHLNSVIAVAGIDAQVVHLLDLLVSPSMTYSKIDGALIAMPWLREKLLTLYNSGELTNGKKPNTVMNQPKTMLNLLGTQNTQIIIPHLLFKRQLPSLTEPFPQTKQRLLDYSTALSNSLYLAFADMPRQQIPLYMYAYHSQLASSVLIKLFFKAFTQVLNEQLQSAEKARLQEQFDIIRTITPEPGACAKLLRRYRDKLTDTLCLSQPFKLLPINAINTKIQQDPLMREKFQACEQVTTLAVANHYLGKDYALVDTKFWHYCSRSAQEKRSSYNFLSPYTNFR